MTSAGARHRLMEAARCVLRERGSAFSLDDVARRAGISKSGLLHHYPTRELLVESICRWLSDEFNVKLNAAYEVEVARRGVMSGAWLRAYIELSFRGNDTNVETHAALACLINAPDQGASVGCGASSFFRKVETDGIPVARAHIVRLACDSIWLGRYSGLPGVPTEYLAILREELTAMTLA